MNINTSRLRGATTLLALAYLSGCHAVWEADGAHHALGLGYISWPSPAQGDGPKVSGNDIIGLALIATRASTGIVVGFSRERMVVLDDNQSVALHCLQCDLLEARASGGTMTPGK